MVGSGRKRKREEKAKTQLKKSKTAPGKHLPKGTNETKVQFKTAKIVIPGHGGEASKTSGPVTNKKLGLKDVLTKLSHFSVSVRVDGLEGLKELALGSSASSLIVPNLSSILTRLVPLTQDLERKLRKLANTIISVVLSQASESSLKPLYSLLSAHLCCALTHIDSRIQLDALNTLDCLLTNAPGFIRACIDNILPNCLDQISTKRKSDNKSSGPSVAENISETMSSLQWRVSVLSRIDRILEVASPNLATSKKPSVVVQEFVPGRCYSLTPTTQPAVMPLSALTSVSTASFPEEHALLILPLLIETWVEARASDVKVVRNSFLPKEVSELLASEAGILDKLVRMMKDEVPQSLRTKFEADLISHFLSNLPYSCPELDCAEANVQLTLLALILGYQLQLDSMKKTLKSKGAKAASTLRLVKRLFQDSHLSSELRSCCVTALVRLLDSVVGEEREDATQLLREQAIKHPGPGVSDWVKNLPGELVIKLKKTADRELALMMMDDCLAMAKTMNLLLATSFMDNLTAITDCIKPEDGQSLHKVACIRHHCEKSIPVPDDIPMRNV